MILDPTILDKHPEWWKLRPESYGQKYVPGWRAHRWIKYVGQATTEAIERGNGRLIINVPWAHGKTQYLAKILPAWFLDRYPARRVITASSSMDLATESGRSTREILYNAGIELAADQNAKGQWRTKEGGGMKATSIGKRIMGFHFNLALVDDLYGSWDDAQSPLYRQKAVDWFINTLYNRALADATIIILMTRFHAEDLTGYLTQNHADEWRVIRLPCFAEADDPLGRAVGETLCPEIFTKEQMQQKRLGGSAEGWDAMGQQAPREASESNVYRHWSEANLDNSLKLNPFLPLQISWDFNSNPGTHVIVGQYAKDVDEFRAVYEIHSPRLSVVDAMDSIKRLIDDGEEKGGLGGFKWPRLEIFGDPAGNAVGAGYQSKHYDTIRLKAQGWGWKPIICVARKHPRIADRVIHFNDALFSVTDRRHYKVHPRCTQLLADLRNQKLDAHGEPDKTRGGHAADAEGYRVHYLRPVGGLVKAATGRFMVT